MPIYLRGLALANYRGFGSDVQTAAPFKDCNFFIGANNSGKSAILNFLSRHLGALGNFPVGKSRLKLDPLEVHVGSNAQAIEVRIPVEVAAIDARLMSGVHPSHRPSVQVLVDRLCSLLRDDDVVWLRLPNADGRWTFVKDSVAQQGMDNNSWYQLWGALFPNMRVGTLEQVMQIILDRASPETGLTFPPCSLIPAIRQIGAHNDDAFDHSGRGLIAQLANLQNPGILEREKVAQFDEINDFLKSVTDEPSAKLEVTYDRKHVLVHISDKVLPLESLGTGIHEVVMLAAFCTLQRESIVCIEEPEIHLHPVLQRKLIRYLQKKTTNQYFIATHSAAFIDTPGAAVFHVHNRNGVTKVDAAILPNQRFSICQDLGYKASDLVQANAVIWVEGPSDRIYIRHWITSLAPDMIEGTHYSIMFYGGRLLSHLSANDQEVRDFIALRRLNRHLAIVIDSDKKSAHAHINDTKKRVLAEFNENGSVGWLTMGREIENYVEPAQLHAAIKEVYGDRYGNPVDTGQYAHALHFVEAKTQRSRRAAGTDICEDIDKVKVARKVCEQPAYLDVLDLRKRITTLVEMIRLANE